MTPQLRDRVLEHAFGCEACTEARPRNVSAARVFSLLPAPALSPQARAELLGSLTAPAAAPLPAPVDLPLAALVQPPPSVTPLHSRVQPVPAPRPVVPGPRPAAHGSGPLPTFTPAPAPAAPAPAPAARAPRPARPGGTRSGRRRRTSLVIAGVGAVASAVAITSAFALAGSSRPPVTVREVTPVAAGTSTGTAPQTSGLGTANPGRVSSGNEAAGLSRTQLTTPPPLVSTAGGRTRVLFTAATQPLSPVRGPAVTRNSAAGQAGPATSASPGTLQLSAGTVNVGTGSAGKITLSALDGPVRWSASSSAPNQVSLSSTAGTLAAGQSVTLAVTVTRGAQAGSATLTFDSAASASQLVLLTWSASPGSGPVTRPVRHPRPHPRRHPYPHPTPSASAPASAPASRSDTTVPDPSGS